MTFDHGIAKFDYTRQSVSVVVDSSANPGFRDGPFSRTKLNAPRGIEYFADSNQLVAVGPTSTARLRVLDLILPTPVSLSAQDTRFVLIEIMYACSS